MNLQNDPRLKNMHPLKREILLRLSNSQSTMTPEQMLPQLMEINKELQKSRCQPGIKGAFHSCNLPLLKCTRRRLGCRYR